MSRDPVAIHGTCHPRFARVREAFVDNFRHRDEIGAAVSVVIDGEPVVDLWAGFADQARTQDWQRDTLANVYSCTKGMAALCLHRLVSEGKVDLDAPVAQYWPEFAQAGKERMPVRWLLSHRSGLAAVREVLPDSALYDWNEITAALAAEEPWWEPGSAHGYHAVTFGWLVGEVVRRVTGKSVGAYFRETIAQPLHADFHIGIVADDHARIAEMSPLSMEMPEGEIPLGLVIMSDPMGLAARAFTNPPSLAYGVNHAAWREAEIPGANGTANARAMARIYGALARGGRLDGVDVLDDAGIARCAEPQSHGPDLVLQVPTRFGLGYMLPQDTKATQPGRGPRSFGHPGAGGHLGFADPDARIGFGYVVNRMGPYILLDPRAVHLIDAVYAAL